MSSIQDDFQRVIQEFSCELNNSIDHYFASHPGKQQKQLKPYLYKVCRHFAFGYADFLNLVLVDGFDPFFRLTNELELPLNQVTLAFCPKLDSLGIRNTGGTLPWLFDVAATASGTSAETCRRLVKKCPFIELHKLLGNPDAVGVHPFQKQTPLMVFSRLKLGSLAILGNGIALRRAVYRAMAVRVVETQFKLLRALEKGNREDRDTLNALEIDASHVLNLKVAFLDCQGSEEVGIYFACTNYSVAYSMLAGICDLTIADILIETTGGSHLRQFVEASGVHRHTRELHPEVDRAKPGDLLEHNHVFSSSYSVAGLSESASETPKKMGRKISGIVEVYCRVDMPSGHLRDSECKLRDTLSSSTDVRRLSWSQVHRFLVGRYDYDFALTWTKHEIIDFLACRELLGVAATLRRAFSETRNTLDETGLLDRANGLVVPVPVLSKNNEILRHTGSEHFPMMTALEHFAILLFGPDGVLSSKTLRDELSKLRLPVRLERTILHVMKCFRDSIVDPLLFDAVLDLYDAVYALQFLLTKDLPDQLEELKKLDFDADEADVFRELLFHDSMIEGIRRFVDGLRDALDHRIRRESRFEFHDWSIDFRGGLNQMVQGATVPMLCGMELLQRCWQTYFERPGFSPEKHREKPAGAVTRLTLFRTSRFRRVQVTDNQQTAMGIFDFSVGHIFLPAEFVEYFEAAGNMILHAWDDEEPELVEPRLQSATHTIGQSEIANRPKPLTADEKSLRQELFAALLSQMLVFGVDWKLGRKCSMLSWNSRPVAAGIDDKELTGKFLRAAFKSFLVTGLFEQWEDEHESRNRKDSKKKGKPEKDWKDPNYWSSDHPWCEEWRTLSQQLPEDERLASPPHFEKFVDFLGEIGPLCPYYDYIRGRQLDNGQKLERVYADTYRIWISLLDDVWWRAKSIYRRFCDSGLMRSKKGRLQREELQKAMDDGLSTGQASLWSALTQAAVIDEADYDLLDDELCLTVHLLSAYSDAESKYLNPQQFLIHSRRSPSKATHTTEKLPLSSHQLDRRLPRAMCSDPKEREARFRRDIAVHRILWDLSARLKAERLTRMVEDEQLGGHETVTGEQLEFCTFQSLDQLQMNTGFEILTEDGGTNHGDRKCKRPK